MTTPAQNAVAVIRIEERAGDPGVPPDGDAEVAAVHAQVDQRRSFGAVRDR